MKKILMLCFAFFAISSVMAQSKVVTGRVTNQSGVGIPNVSVVVEGSTIGATTNAEGDFSLSVPAATKTLIVSSVGYGRREVPVTSGPINVTLETEASSIEEVVVVGYGTQKKVNVTGAISSVKASDLENVPNGRVEQTLQGRVSGVTIMQNSGQPGSASTIQIRGVTTFNNNNPLWVVDGVVVDAGGIGYINQSDIESIDVLKDAASAAIYGTRAAAGVILVTTKKGKSGKLSINYNGFYGLSQPTKRARRYVVSGSHSGRTRH